MGRQAFDRRAWRSARVIIPKRYAWKGAKFIREIVFLDRDILGFWELRGYSNTADPFIEDRFDKPKNLP
jgi:DMSO/TMAO reductase YedYZ molybdopterin-dependent catalytic subunit